nr:type II toxin-antitoxin system VapC family toxin [uncultured Kingella sp.]
MNIAVDTNVLVRLLTADDVIQQQQAIVLLDSADGVIVPTTVFCETVWVLRRLYRQSNQETAAKLEGFLRHPKLLYQTGEVEAGFAMMRQGGDFADGVNEYAGRQMGAEMFVTFDKQAAKLLKAQGKAVRIP